MESADSIGKPSSSTKSAETRKFAEKVPASDPHDDGDSLLRDSLAALSADAKWATSLGAVISFRCALGYRLVGASEVHCTSASQWSEPFPTCERKCAVEGFTAVLFEGSFLKKAVFWLVLFGFLVVAEGNF